MRWCELKLEEKFFSKSCSSLLVFDQFESARELLNFERLRKPDTWCTIEARRKKCNTTK